MTLPGFMADSETLDVNDLSVFVTIIDDADAAGGNPSTGRFTNGLPGGNRVETFEVTGLTPGIDSVASTWRVRTLNASDVPVTICSSAGGPVLRYLTANQREPSNDCPVATTWHSGFEEWADDSNAILPRSPRT